MQTPSDIPQSAPSEQKPARHLRSTAAVAEEAEPQSGWQIFAGTMIVIAGLLNIFDGVVALWDTSYYTTIVQTTNGPQLVVTNNVHSWGWFAFIMGLVMVATAVGIFFGTVVGQVVGIILAGLNVLFQFAFLPVFPIWSIIMIIVDVLVIYALVARYRSAY